jgi:hexosaminidase
MILFTILSVVFSLLGSELAHAENIPTPSIIPLPCTIKMSAGPSFVLRNGAAIEVAKGDLESQEVAGILRDLVGRTTSLHLNVSPSLDSSAHSIQFIKLGPSNADDESYSLEISADQGVIIKASTHAGLFYGAVTLWQILTSDRGASQQGILPALKIDDHPEMKWRGFLLDSARHFQTTSFIYHIIDLMALHKLNVLHWHLTDDQAWRIEIKKYPRLTSFGSRRFDPETGKWYGGFYTQDEIRKIVSYALKRNVTIIPEIEMPGHSSAAVVSYPMLASTNHPIKSVPVDFGVLPNLMSPTEPTFEFLHGVLDEVMALFPSPVIHIGGDEATKEQWQKSVKIQKLKNKLGLQDETALQDWFMVQIGMYIEAHGRKAIGYFYPGAEPSRSSIGIEIYLPQNPIRKFLSEGHDIVELMFPKMYFDEALSEDFPAPAGIEDVNTLENVYSFNPIPHFLTKTERSHLLGLEGALWTEDISSVKTAETLTFPREIAVAELGWTKRSHRKFPDFVRRLVAEYARFKSLGQMISDIPYRPVVEESEATSTLNRHVTSTNQTKFGEFHYTLDGKEPSLRSPIMTAALDLRIGKTLKIATFVPVSGEKISETITSHIGKPKTDN